MLKASALSSYSCLCSLHPPLVPVLFPPGPTLAGQRLFSITMDGYLRSIHVEDSGPPAVIQGAQIVSNVDLMKAGADDIKEDNVANVHLVCLPFSLFKKHFTHYSTGSCFGSK